MSTDIKNIYNKYASEIGDMSDNIFDKIVQQGLIDNTLSNLEENVRDIVNKIVADIDEIKSINSPFINTLLRVYSESLSVEEAKNKHNQMLNVHKNAAFGFRKSHELNKNENSSSKDYNRTEDGFVNVKIKANDSQMRQIREFLNTIGVDYEL